MRLDSEEDLSGASSASAPAHRPAGLRDSPSDELAATREALRRSNERVQKVLESITDGFVVVDPRWRVTYNREFAGIPWTL